MEVAHSSSSGVADRPCDDDRGGDNNNEQETSSSSSGWTSIPVIDLASAEGAAEKELEVAQSLVRALETVGFVTLVNHGVDTDAALQSAQQFFQLPLHSKLTCPYQGHTSNRGYLPMGSECHDHSGGKNGGASSADAKETFELDDTSATLWPNEFPENSNVRTTLLHYYDNCYHLHLRLLRLVALGLGLDSETFAAHGTARHCNLRLLHYPATPIGDANCGSDRDGVVVRGACHTDFGTLTLLAQDSVGGLRIQQPRDCTTMTPGQQHWISVPPTPGALVVNVGDMLQRWTNGRLMATPHQVVGLLKDAPERDVGDDNDGGGDVRGMILPERYSVAFFCNANPDTDLRPIPSLVPHGEAPQFEPITALQYLTQRLAATIQTPRTGADLFTAVQITSTELDSRRTSP